jgi:hypothetical protein
MDATSLAPADTYSYLTVGERWINHEWLAERIFAALYTHGGPAALVAFKMAAALALCGLLFWHLRREGVDPLPAVLLLAWASLLLMPGLRPLRPQLFTYLLFAVEMLVLVRADAGPTRLLWLLPPMFALWANLHGGWLAGVVVLLLWCVWHTRAWALVAASVAATLVTPYGITLWRFIATAVPPRPDIAEWTPIQLLTPHGAVYVGFVLLGVAGLIRERGRLFAFRPVVFAVCACLPLRAERHLPLFAIVAILVAGAPVVDAISCAARRRWPASGEEGSVDLGRWIAGVALVMAVVVAARIPREMSCLTVDAAAFPVDTVALLKDNDAHGRLVVFYDWGEYAIWHLAPAVAVSIDGRRETVYSDRISTANDGFQAGAEGWSDFLEIGRPDFVLTSPRLAAARLMADQQGWDLVATDAASVLFARRGALPHALRTAPVRPPQAACFP